MKGIIYEVFQNVRSSFTGPFLRSLGKKMYQVGTNIQGAEASEDRLVPSLRNLKHEDNEPSLQQTNFVAPNATILGKVHVGSNSSIWYNATLLGTIGIKIGDNSVIQDRAHLSRQIKIGDNVYIGPNTIIQGSTIMNRGYVGMGSTVRHATIESEGCVAAGAVIPDNTVVKEGQIWAGNPGKFLRKVTPTEREVMRDYLNQMHDLAAIHNAETEKSMREVLSGCSQPYEYFNFQDMLQNLQDYPLNYSEKDEQFIQRRVFMRQKLEYGGMGKDYEPYEYDTSHLDRKFRVGVHDEELKKVVTKLKEKQAFQRDTNPWKSAF